ncbi:MAG TPA: substrate-binding domain-containing protein [Casimicrobiaceae bacterium]|nr:substrate-binding domain-containing protein [Casimicrobiaceae bacterium]
MTKAGHVDCISGIASMAMRHVLAESSDAYTQMTGQRVNIASVGGVDAERRVQEGEAFDFVVLAADAIEKLADLGRVDASSRTDLARSDIGIAVAAGAPKPDISSEAAVRDAVLHAKNIGYSTGPSGAHLMRLLERWSIVDVIAPHLVRAAPGVPVGTLIARGDAELGFQQLSELMNVPGIDVIGMLPHEIQRTTVFSAATCTTSMQRASTSALLAYFASEQADAVKRRHGMQPARTRT